MFPPRIRGLVSLWSLTAFGLAGIAADEPSHVGPQLADLVDETLRQRRPLSAFVGSGEAIPLEGSKSDLEIDIPLSPRLYLAGGEVEVHFLHAVGLRSDRSRLRVYWDQHEIAAAPLGGLRRDGRVVAELPRNEPSVERYRLRLAVELRADEEEAGKSGAPEEVAPWTQIDPTRSWVALDYRLRPLLPNLDEMRMLVDERLWNDQTLTIVTAPVYATDEEHLQWGGRVAQRMALWQGERSLAVRHDDRLTRVGDEVAIGTRDELIGVLPREICDQVTASFVGVYPHPEDDRHFLLVLSGTEPEGVDRAVRAFCYFPEKMPPMPRIDVTGWDLPGKDPTPTGGIEGRRLRMPDLQRWSREGFPGATGAPVMAGCDLWVTHRDSETLACAWMVAGKLAQVAGGMVSSLHVVGERPAAGRHWIALGDRDALPSDLAGASPLPRVFVEGELMGRRGVLTQFESPLKKGRAAIFITAEDRLLLQDRVTELIRPAFWDTLHGDTVAWNPGGLDARFQRLAVGFEIGEPGFFLRAWRLVGDVPWMSVIFGMIGAAMIVWLLRHPVHDPDPDGVAVTKRNGNRRVSRSRRIREAARRAARLARLADHRG